MLSKTDHVDYWKQSSADSWETASYLYEGKKYLKPSFYFALLLKILKARWVKDNVNNFPPAFTTYILYTQKLRWNLMLNPLTSLPQ